MSSIKEQINSIIANRKLLLPKINEKISLLTALQNDISNLHRNINSLRKKEGIPEDITQICDNFEHNTLVEKISETINALKLIEKRYSRSTINIGVAGKARVGKSTFLQTLSGLTDTQIPTGSGLPVTATRSRIFNSSQRRAIVTFYSEYEFCNVVLKTFFDELGLDSLPQSIDEFEKYRLPSDSIDRNNNQELLLVRLERMQKAIFSYKEYLGRGEKVFELEDIKPFVAYPTEKEEFIEKGKFNDNCKRPYLAVKDVRIECPFPVTDVENLGIMDLPGLGENVPKELMNSFMNYKSEVDLVVLLTRPTEASAYFDKTDIEALDCADIAKGPIKQKSDYSIIVINNGGLEAASNTLENDIRTRCNARGANYLIIKGNVKDSHELRQNITSKILSHLAESLERMDKNYEIDSSDKFKYVIDQCYTLLNSIKALVARHLQNDMDPNEINDNAEELQEDLAVELQNLLKEYKNKISDIDSFEEEVETHHKKADEWITKGLGFSTPAEWKEKAKRVIKKNRGSGKLVNDEFNKIRNYINQSYSHIDFYLDKKVKELRKSIANSLKKCTKDLVKSELGDEYLSSFLEKCNNTYRVCSSMKEAIDTILNSEIEYRSHFHPKVRQVIEPLFADNNEAVNVKDTDDEIDNLYNYLKELAEGVNYETQKAICKEAELSGLILYSWLVDFEDKFIRDKDSDAEFRELVYVYKEQIWPERYNKIVSFKEDLGKINKLADISLIDLEKLRGIN